MKEPVVQVGDLLIASGALVDPNFHQAVVLICSHEAESGTYGLVLNRPLPTRAELVEKMPFVENRLYRGGPVQQDTMQVLHPYGKASSPTIEVLPGLWIGGDFDELRQGYRNGLYAPDRCRFFLGYSGWDSGQLLAEFESGSWLSVAGSRQLVLDTPASRLWSESIRSCASADPLYANFPENPSWN